MKTYKKGISLIVLVITIIVMAILASAVIISLSNANIISQANNARFKSDMQSYKEAYELHVAEQLMATNGAFDRTTITTAQLANILGDAIKDEYKDDIVVESGKLVYITNDTVKKDVLTGLGMATDTTNYTQADIDASNGKIVAVGVDGSIDTIAIFNDDETQVTITKNGAESDGIVKAGAISEATTLTSAVISEGIVELGNGVFWGCTNLQSIVIPSTVRTMGMVAFEDCTSLTNVTIKNGATGMGAGIFGGCTSLTSITIPGSMYSISNSAFQNCTNLANVVLSDGVEKIEPYAFAGCTGLTTMNIPSSVATMGEAPFENCTSLTTINFEAATAPEGFVAPEGVTVNYNVSM